MSVFSENVYACAARVPRGKVATYGQIARVIGRPRAARQVGISMAHAPEGLPCHRVISSTGALSPQDVFGAGVQRAMLMDEGIVFSENGNVDLVNSQCKDDELR